MAIEALRAQPASEIQDASDAPLAPVPILQEKDLKLQVLRDGRPWNVHLQLVHDPAADFYSTALETQNGEDVITVRLNLEHDFSVAFINDNEDVLQPMLRFIAALALAEHLARDAGVKNAAAVRRGANEILRKLAIARGAS